MTTTIALAGKGGTGKTTVAALLVDILVKRGEYPILAIDADPSSNLNLALGVPLNKTVGDLREDLLADVQRTQMALGVSQREMLDVQIRMAVEEGEDFDLIAMGKPEGPGCYCPVNHSLRQIIDVMSESYAYVIMDNEAGMEHLSRRTTRDVEWLLLISDPTVRGVTAIGPHAEDGRRSGHQRQAQRYRAQPFAPAGERRRLDPAGHPGHARRL